MAPIHNCVAACRATCVCPDVMCSCATIVGKSWRERWPTGGSVDTEMTARGFLAGSTSSGLFYLRRPLSKIPPVLHKTYDVILSVRVWSTRVHWWIMTRDPELKKLFTNIWLPVCCPGWLRVQRRKEEDSSYLHVLFCLPCFILFLCNFCFLEIYLFMLSSQHWFLWSTLRFVWHFKACYINKIHYYYYYYYY